MPKLLITFPSVHFAIRAEKFLKESEIPSRMIPTPRAVSASCGLCLLLEMEEKDRLLSFDMKTLERSAIYVYDEEERIATRLD